MTCCAEPEVGLADQVRAGAGAVVGVVVAVHDLGGGMAIAAARLSIP